MNLFIKFCICSFILTSLTAAIAESEVRNKSEDKTDCLEGQSPSDVLLRSYNSIEDKKWLEYASFINPSDLVRFKDTYVELFMSLAPESKVVAIHGKVINKETLPDIPLDNFFAVIFEDFVLKEENPLIVLNFLEGVSIKDTIMIGDASAKFLLVESYNINDSSYTFDIELELVFINGCWKAQLHPMVEDWRKAIEHTMNEGKAKRKN